MVPCTKFLEYADEFFADDLSLRLRIGHTGQLVIVTLLRIYADKIQLIRAVRTEYCLYLIALVLAKQTMIYKYAGQLLANCLGQQNRRYGRIHTTRQCTKNLAIADLLTKGSNRILNERIHLPVAAAAAHVVYEIAEHLLAFYCMKNFRMELYGIQIPAHILHRRDRAYRSIRCDLKAFRSLCNIIRMTHPAYRLRAHTLEDLAVCLPDGNFRLAVLADRSRLYLSVQQVSHQLRAVANTQDRNAHLENLRRA